MSGGSFNCICYKDSKDLLNEIVAESLEDIRVAILAHVVDKKYPADARLVVNDIEWVQTQLAQIKALQVEIDHRMRAIEPVLCAVEWNESCDCGVDEVVKQVGNYVRNKVHCS